MKGNEKHAASKFKDGVKLLSYYTARKNDSFVGILDDDKIMVEINDIDKAEILLEIVEEKHIQCSLLETTNGMSFYFKGYEVTTNKIKWFSNIGLLCDYKLGIKNTADSLNTDGETRRWLRQANEHELLPSWLYPYNKINPNLIKMIEGDGRNDKLFTYILKL
ncbi:hypothetical protein LLR47_26590 [Bacillus cereus]|nr:hypothetical protein [Bacillus cereus]